ncbi:family 22 glycosyltransferase [Cryphonectria parasitica EP155]|uniref:Mannosyltransferase n=1 Tax=Cryphonectria parasitica (strain ATCC 38755 / EP155) TaxID=660469 RepID=A0A9P4YB11_CRYP1|nr:family 22 glycosyltransferase [Cryphonectria parasitica EP155]KAF3770041.1 family 22 glycosyltransferase [Cryphonectria parasitica EP155]
MSTHEARQPTHSQHGLWLQSQHVLIGLLIIRLVNALCTGHTFFQPDEYFQALEPAWSLAFGPNSGAWITWEWKYHLRSSLHPALFAAAYAAADKITAVLPCAPSLRASLLTVLPKLVQACLAVVGDFYTWKLAERVYGQGSRSAWSALCITVLNPWQWYCTARTFSNSLEMTLTVTALRFWPWDLLGDVSETYGGIPARRERLSSLRVSLCLAALAVLLRPTNVFIWATVVFTALARPMLRGKSPITPRILFVLVREAVLCGSAALLLSALSDRLYFGEWTFPPYHFLQFNLSQDLAVFYGEMDWHYYLSQGITQLTMTFLPFALIGLYRSTTSANPEATALQSNTLKTLALIVITTITTLSLISHKEVRFILPLLPVLHILAAPSFASLFSAPPGRQPSQAKTALLAGLIFVNLVIAAYLSLFHAAAPISVMHFLRHEYERIHPDRLTLHAAHPVPPPTPLDEATDELFALFLTPCHATPWRSHLVYPSLRARALTCEPPLHTAPRSEEREAYMDETKRFYQDFGQSEDWGVGFLAEEMWPPKSNKNGREGEVPRYIVGFESIEPMLRTFFDKEDGKGAGGGDMMVRLRKVWRGWNGLFSDDERKEGFLAVWETGVFSDETPVSL